MSPQSRTCLQRDKVEGGRRTVEEPPVEISMNRIAVSACLLSTSRVAFHLNGDKIGLQNRHMRNESAFTNDGLRGLAFEYLKKKAIIPLLEIKRIRIPSLSRGDNRIAYIHSERVYLNAKTRGGLKLSRNRRNLPFTPN